MRELLREFQGLKRHEVSIQVNNELNLTSYFLLVQLTDKENPLVYIDIDMLPHEPAKGSYISFKGVPQTIPTDKIPLTESFERDLYKSKYGYPTHYAPFGMASWAIAYHLFHRRIRKEYSRIVSEIISEEFPSTDKIFVAKKMN